MNIDLHFDQVRHSPWLDQFLEKRLERLEKFLRPDDLVKLNLKSQKDYFETHLSIHHVSKTFDFSATGESLFESFFKVIDQALRVLNENNKKRIQKRELRGD
jgi:ribosome-associated translation inhibitor RaiA